MFVEDGPPAGAFDGTLSIVCFNIAHGRGPVDGNWDDRGVAKRTRVEAIGRFLRDLDADVVVLNEVDFFSTWSGHQNQAAAIARAGGYRYRVEQRNLDFRFGYGSWRFGNVILSRFPIVNATQIDYPAEHLWEDWLVGCKRGVVAEIGLEGGVSCRVAAVHLEHRSESVRFESAKRLIELVDETGGPLVAAGDFNSTPRPFPHSSTSPGGDNAMESLIESGQFQHRPVSLPQPFELTFPSIEPRSVIDWILLSGQSTDPAVVTEYLEYRVVESELSDHSPVYAKIKIGSGEDRDGE